MSSYIFFQIINQEDFPFFIFNVNLVFDTRSFGGAVDIIVTCNFHDQDDFAFDPTRVERLKHLKHVQFHVEHSERGLLQFCHIQCLNCKGEIFHYTAHP